jgi:hypothetical protein
MPSYFKQGACPQNSQITAVSLSIGAAAIVIISVVAKELIRAWIVRAVALQAPPDMRVSRRRLPVDGRRCRTHPSGRTRSVYGRARISRWPWAVVRTPAPVVPVIAVLVIPSPLSQLDLVIQCRGGGTHDRAVFKHSSSHRRKRGAWQGGGGNETAGEQTSLRFPTHNMCHPMSAASGRP